MDIWNTLAALPFAGPYLPYIGAFGLLCAALATILPPPAATGAAGWYVTLYSAVNWCGLNFGHARNAGASIPVTSSTSPAAGFLALFGFAALLGLAACQNGAVNVAAICQTDAQLQPVAVALAPAAGAEVASLASIDAQVVHPAVLAACAGWAASAKPVGVAVPVK